MAPLDLNPLLNLILIIIELVILVGFFIIYFRNKNAVLKPLIWSIALFLCSNVLSFLFYATYTGAEDLSLIIIILAHLLLGGGLLLLVFYFEMFTNKDPFSKRSTIATIFILITGILQMMSNFMGPPLSYLGLLTPIPYVITGIMYMRYIGKIQSRARIPIQKKKIKRVKTGVFMIFVSSIVFYAVLGVLFVIAIILVPEDVFVEIGRTPNTFNLGSIDPIVMLSQLIGILLISIPILKSRSIYFMQSQKISRLIVIKDSGLPIYDFNFEQKGASDELLLSGALTAIKTVMSEATGASKDLKTIVFEDVEILTEVRDSFAVNLIVDGSSAYIKEALRLFTDNFQLVYKQNIDSSFVDHSLQKEVDKLVQKTFGLEDEEMMEILDSQERYTTPATVV